MKQNKYNHDKDTPPVKRRYNLCYRARQKGYKINTPGRTIYRPKEIDRNIEAALREYGFHVQLTIFE